jgi:hypothetical protein
MQYDASQNTATIALGCILYLYLTKFYTISIPIDLLIFSPLSSLLSPIVTQALSFPFS